MLVLWRLRSAELAQLHEGARCYYRTVSDLLSLSSLAMSAVASSAAVLNGVGSVSGGLTIATGVIGVLSTVLVSVNTFMAPAKLQQAHDDCQKKYMKMARDITVHMHLDSVGTDQMFINIHQCMRYMQNIFDDLEDQAPAIPKFIVKKMEDGARDAIDASDSRGARDKCDFYPDSGNGARSCGVRRGGRGCRGGSITNSMYRFSDSECSLDIVRQDSIRRGQHTARFSPIVETNSAGHSFNDGVPAALPKAMNKATNEPEAAYDNETDGSGSRKPSYTLPHPVCPPAIDPEVIVEKFATAPGKSQRGRSEDLERNKI
jgi:hypothetical protein